MSSIKIKSLPKILLSNVQSLNNKFLEFSSVLCTEKIELALITETWLNVKYHDNLFFEIPGYRLFRYDRINGEHGGVAAYCADYLKPIQITPISSVPDGFECIFIKFKSGKLCCLLTCFYCPPIRTANDKKQFVKFLTENYDYFLGFDPLLQTCIGGDFNSLSPDILCNKLNLKKMVIGATRGKNCLDNILLSPLLQLAYNSSVISPGIGKSDHNTIILPPKEAIETVTKLKTFYNLDNRGKALFLESLANCDFRKVYSATNIEEKCKEFYNSMDKCLGSIPKRKIYMTIFDKPWMTPWLKCQITERWDAYNEKNWVVYNHLKLKVKSNIEKAIKNWKLKCSNSAKSLWDTVKLLKNTKCNNIGMIIDKFADEYAAANKINEFFGSQFGKKNFTCVPAMSDIISDIWK
jgi:hypothetical protein